nr:MAG TPA: hypothetical protein [Caudoviricetes sp.]
MRNGMAMGNLMPAKVATRMVVLLQRPKGGKPSPNFTKMTCSARWRNERGATSGRGVERREPNLRTNKERRCFYRNCICLIFR